jgi:hypothetical protein
VARAAEGVEQAGAPAIAAAVAALEATVAEAREEIARLLAGHDARKIA